MQQLIFDWWHFKKNLACFCVLSRASKNMSNAIHQERFYQEKFKNDMAE